MPPAHLEACGAVTPLVLGGIAGALVLALIHFLAGFLQFLKGVPRSRWLSFAGGVSIAYVIVHLLPELSEHQETLAASAGPALAFLELHVYLVTLTGLAVYYGLERMVRRHKQSRSRAQSEEAAGETESQIFWIHVVSFGLYNFLVGYLLVTWEEPGSQSLLFFFLAMAFHFIVNDYGLEDTHQEDYQRKGRWILAAALLVGAFVGVVFEIHEAIVALLTAFLAGGIILNTLKEELPAERESRFGAFVLGAAAYAVLLTVL